MLTSRLDLDGTWQFQHALDPSGPPGPVRTIQVPGPWQAQCADLRTVAGTGWYSRTVAVPPGWVRGSVRLHFGAVFHVAEVAVNGIVVGSHIGGFLPFSFEVAPHLRDGAENLIEVRAEGPVDGLESASDLALDELPFGKQSWYGPLTGIWQSVFLERRDPDHLRNVRIDADPATGRVEVGARLARLASAPLEIEAQIDAPDGTLVAAALGSIAIAETSAILAARVGTVSCWSPDAPLLYRLTVTLRRHGELIDRISETFGFRSFEAREGRFWLNGDPFYLRAALDQDYWPDGICTPPSVAALEDQLRKAKELGLNCLRCHIKVPDPRYYAVADRLGMLIWTELPNSGRATPTALARAEATFRGILERDGNHPSIVCWTIINENWGVDLVHDATHRAWVEKTRVWLKAADPRRLVVDNSPLAPSRHTRTDIADYHFYAAHPEHREAWDHFVGQLARRPAWLFTHTPDAAPTGEEPLVCSEFGVWGLPDPARLADAEGREPWWFETGHDWGDGIAYPHGVEQRFRDWSLDRVFGSFVQFAEAAQWHQFRGLRYQIAALRREASIAGYVVTELADCQWECNGLLDMRRNPRVFHRELRTVNADTVIVPMWHRTSLWAGDRFELPVAVAHGAGAELVGTNLEVGFADRPVASLAVPKIPAGSVATLPALQLVAPDVATASVQQIDLRLVDGNGDELNRFALELVVHPRTAPCGAMRIWTDLPDAGAHLQALGHRLVDDPDSADLLVTDGAGAVTAGHVRDGGRLLLLPSEPIRLEPLFPHWQNVRVIERRDTLWMGDWVATFTWQRREGPFASLPGGPLVDEAFDRVLPTHVIAGCNLLDFQARVSAGMVLGWVHKSVAITVERAYGRGRLVVSTWRLFRDAPGTDPTAVALLRALVAAATKPDTRMLPESLNEPLPRALPKPAVPA